jgi:Uma2 family endonuclease
MKTLLKIGPKDHGKPIDYEDFAAAAWEEGYQYELIDGKLYVAPQANFPQGYIEKWVYDELLPYSKRHAAVINYVHQKARVFVPHRPGITIPEPDVTAFRDFPRHLPFNQIRWEDLSPVLVVEVLSLDDPDKDLVRNVELYLQVPTIREYWIIDTRQSVAEPIMYVYRRRGQRWQRRLEIHFGETYTTGLLPGFMLVLNPQS